MKNQNAQTDLSKGLEEVNRFILPDHASFVLHSDEAGLCTRFLRHVAHVPTSRMEVKILSAIQFTADMLSLSDAHVAKILVDHGLRVPRRALPADFLKFADGALQRSGWEVGGPTAALLELKAHWDRIGEDRFAGFKYGEYYIAETAAF